MSALDIHIRQLVWHGAGRPDASALARAIESALARSPTATAAAPGQGTPLAAYAAAIAREIAPSLASAEGTERG